MFFTLAHHDIHFQGYEEGGRFYPFEIPGINEVFSEDFVGEEVSMDYSLFVRGLEGLQSFKTQGGAGLLKFLDENVSQFDDRMVKVIRQLAREVCKDAE